MYNKEVVDLITDILGNPGFLGRSADEVRRKYIWVGLVKEMNPDVTYPELAQYTGAKSHSSLHGQYQSWCMLPWTTRYAWIEFMFGSDTKRLLMKTLAEDPTFKKVDVYLLNRNRKTRKPVETSETLPSQKGRAVAAATPE